ncbi:prolyl 4-hydroxylase subunit alpha-2 [Drosophila guanche]|uniref:procollagen-proline 4-dioxygenase n=1 Tax=Drosophila guanche TaxID=7266 RepID=A0A3B0JZE7_DROGU|nr:prolyl 4-hydroxylase subunit alpha-2 [Drosophila guanche]SPP80890.1 blast:Prolyl 4-hydroxylase subunit alpha-2 [Drosophila guanche]
MESFITFKTAMLPIASMPELLLILLIVASVAVRSQTEKEFLALKEEEIQLQLLDRERISNLMEYAEELQSKVEVLKRFAEAKRTPLQAAKGREEEYLSNPLHSFRLIRHMHEDWRHVEKFMRQPVGQDQINFFKERANELPSKEDADDATEAIYRIIRTYDVPPEELVQGLIDGVRYNGSISAIDCFSLGTLHFEWGKYEKAVDWLNHSLTLLKPEYNSVYNVLGFTSSEVHMLLARCYVEMDQEEDARSTLLSHPTLSQHSERLLTLYNNTRHVPVSADLQPLLPDKFNQICRSSHQNKPSRLHCRYNGTTSPFLRLAPLRMEELSLDPYIVVYHNVLTDAEIAKVEQIAEPLLEHSSVYVAEIKKAIKSKVRTALGAWIPDSDMDASGWTVVQGLHRRIRDITGLNINEQQHMQIIKYGYGGHYDPHFDYFNATVKNTLASGDRMVTVLFYLNDARHGGSTVFTHLKLKVPSERGKVLFWYNMRGESHELDTQTVHGACPVIHGTKSVMSCWIHELDQMFIQPTYRRNNRTLFHKMVEHQQG